MSLPTPETDLTVLEVTYARFSPMLDADNKAQFAEALSIARTRGMPENDTEFRKLTATDAEDLLLKINTRIVALIKDLSVDVGLLKLITAIQPVMPLLDIVKALMIRAHNGELPEWPLTIEF
ncbi:MAG: hypothetical protein GC134_05915 [Proteobacteria bacterium]|nr:hypothetical protein [Pseudomonadota bacterium]